MSERKRFHPNRTKFIVSAIACAVMMAGGIWIIADGSWFGYVVAAFFGLCLVVSLLLVWPSCSYLELDDSGFLFRNLFQDYRASWADVESFEARRLGVRKLVTFKLASHHTELPNVRRVAQAVSGTDAALPDTYGMPAEELARMLNEYVQKYRHSATSSAT